MKYSEAYIEFAKLIKAGHYRYEEEAGLAIQVMHDSINDGDDPAMALALAKNFDTGEAPELFPGTEDDLLNLYAPNGILRG